MEDLVVKVTAIVLVELEEVLEDIVVMVVKEEIVIPM
jgi:hypothetical protein